MTRAERPASAPSQDRAAFLEALRVDPAVPALVAEAFADVPREAFSSGTDGDPYAEEARPIDCGETQYGPLFAARLLAALDIAPSHRILEIGTGSGYVTALLARIGEHVTSLERYRRLLDAASNGLRKAGLTNVALYQADGRAGFASGAPFDRVIVHAAFASEPRAFLGQVAPQGVMLAAIGPGEGRQMLIRHTKTGSRFERESLFEVRYQPLAQGTAAAL